MWSALDEPPPDARFPVFLRIADDHAGARTGLLADRAALAAELERQAGLGAALEGWIACEYAAERRPEGCYVKHGAFIVDGVVAPRHLMFGSDWVVKASDLPVTPGAFHEAWLYMVMNPHADVLARVFALAGVEYGRVDYLVTREGRVRVWEINTNPHISSLSAAGDVSRRVIQDAWHRRYEAIMRALDRVVASPAATPTWLERLRWRSLRSRQPYFGVSFVERALWDAIVRTRAAARRR